MSRKIKNSSFRISPKIIWGSSLVLGLLASVPEIPENKFFTAEALINSCVTAAFSLFAWYYNIYSLSRGVSRSLGKGISYAKLGYSLLLGLVIMFALAGIQQLLLSDLNFGPVMLMIEVRGILINLVFYMMIHLLYQNYHNQQINLELERTRSDKLGAQYESLKQQINPHFLFNSLNTLKAMVESGDKKAVEFILKLAGFYRYTLESRKLDLIPLAEEIEIMDAYLFLLKERFEDGIVFTSSVDKACYDSLIPPFTLQLLVENCIKHNVVSLDRPLHIRLYNDDQAIIVENPVQPKMNEDSSLGVGLKNINLRYSHLMNKEIAIVSTQDKFKVKLPLIYEYHSH